MFKQVGKGQAEQLTSYSRNDLPIAPQLVEAVVELVKSAVAGPAGAARSPNVEAARP